MTLTRSEPRTAATAVAITVGVSTLRGPAGPPLPPGVFSPFLPVILVIVRFGWEPLARVLGASVLLVAASSGGLPLDAGHVIGDVDAAVASSVCALVGAALGALVLAAAWAPAPRATPSTLEPLEVTAGDPESRWIGFARMLFKPNAGPRARTARSGCA